MPGRGRVIRRLIPSFAAAATGYAATAMLGSAAWAMPTETADEPTPCWSDRIAITASPTQAAVGHRAATLVFSLAGGAEPCTLTGYPGVDSGSGGPLIHAQPTLRGYMGGLPGGADVPPTVILSLSSQAQAVVEGMAIDANGDPCPTYTELLVNPPDTTVVLSVPATIDACGLQVHPVTPV
ncbi:DUF4232 domain-containing protein [Mycobacterium sp. SMC-2]|uniref:DUF4232 domain-containing protein n=1 Tax=Mycobacterium sp. SMC-2 TaxID=2857058 RepID=UPI0021B2E154|nr:DUF4232 domain-containing protein [Mycobacterium sp. SMC-2]UXA06874.1 DUF4232 domain-containing protein [Mycobacterium sp. SMC-2]